MVKKSRRYVIIGLASLVVVLAIISVIVASNSPTYSSLPFGHGADVVYVQYQDNPTTLQDAIAKLNTRVSAFSNSQQIIIDTPSCNSGSANWCATTNSCLADGQTCPQQQSAQVTSSLIVRVDSGTYQGVPISDESCHNNGYEIIAHIHGSLTNGIGLHSFESNNERIANDGWLSLCFKTSDKNAKDITSVLSENYCRSDQIDRTSCPEGYTQVGSITRSVGSCDVNQPQLGGDTRTSSLSTPKGKLLICQKGLPEFKMQTSTALCGSDTTLAHIITTRNSASSGYTSFCKSG